MSSLSGFRAVAFNVFRVVMAGLCLYLAYVSGKWGLADFYANRSYQVVKSWQHTPPTIATWREAYGPLRRALQLDSTNPTYNHRMGRIYNIRMALDILHSERWGREAIEYYEKSLAVRPKWPLTWANYALVKVDLMQYDGKLDNAIIKATDYGPWEPGVHQIISAIGAGGLARFPLNVRAAIVANNARGLISPVDGAPAHVVRNLERYTREDLTVMMPQIGAALLAAHWRNDRFKRYRTFARVAFEFWSYLPSGQRAAFAARLAQVASDSVVDDLAVQYQKVGMLCPFLPRGPTFDKLCSNTRLRKE